MELIPAIDLRGGRCVRLYQGDYSKETVFSEDPVAMARHWEELGAPRLHIVDLDGALLGTPANLEVVKTIRKKVAIPLQFGGGLRQLSQIEEVLDLGVARVILGTTAVAEPSLVREACRRFGEAIIVSLDAQDGYVAVRGWREKTPKKVLDILVEMTELGVKRFIYTDIRRDGTLSGPNFQALAELKKHTPLPLLASGGISSIGDLRKLAQIGVEGAIVGQALYTGAIDLRGALRESQTRKRSRTHKFEVTQMKHLDSSARANQLPADKIMSLLPLFPNQVVADIGCGTGFFTLPLAQHLPRGQVFALDIAQEMVERASDNVRHSGVINVEVKLCQESDFPIEPGSLDGVFLALVLHEQEERETFLRKVKGLLHPKGWVGIVEYVKRPNLEGAPFHERIDSTEVIEMATQAGFKVIQETSLGENFYMLVLEN